MKFLDLGFMLQLNYDKMCDDVLIVMNSLSKSYSKLIC